MGKLIDIFGKETGIRRSDLEKNIIENSLEESINLEYKSFEGLTKIEQDDIEDNIIRILISFLNRIEKGSCILILGVRASDFKPEYLAPIKKDLLSEDKIRNWITNYISSIPSFKTFPSFRIVEVECPPENESVFLIEINPYEDVLFYSKISESAYVRRGTESVKLSLVEIMTLIQTKRTPNIRLEFKDIKLEKVENNKIRLSSLLISLNIGSRPATDVSVFLSINVTKGKKEDIVVKSSNFIDITSLNPDTFKTFRYALGVITHDQSPLYPELKQMVGDIEIIFGEDTELYVPIQIYDDSGKTLQIFIINKDGVKEVESFHSNYIK